MIDNPRLSPSFRASELRCRGTGLLQLAPGFLQALQGLRDAFTLYYTSLYGAAGAAFAAMVIVSCCRAKAYNDRPVAEGGAGGHERSLHVGDKPYWPTGGCCATDVRAVAGEVHHGRSVDEYRAGLSATALERGWSVGYHPSFLHLDLRTAYAGLRQAEFNY